MSNSKLTSGFFAGRADVEDEQSIDFSVDPAMLEKLEIRKPRNGEEFSTYEADKMYRYQLEKDEKKIVKKKGRFNDRNNAFVNMRMTDPDFRKFAAPKTLGEEGDFIALQNQTIPISWTATTKPYGEIAHKRYLEWLANLPKGPTEEEIRDKQQRQLDQDLWAKIITGRLEPTKAELEKAAHDRRLRELREQGLLDEDDEDDLQARMQLSVEEERRLFVKAADFGKLRALPTRREFLQSKKRWHRGIYFPYNAEKGFPVVLNEFTMRDVVAESEAIPGANHNPTFSGVRMLKGLHQNEKNYVDYLATSNYEMAKEYLERRKDRLERVKAKEAKKKAVAEHGRRRVGMQGATIHKDMWQARLAHTKATLNDTVHVEETDGHEIHASPVRTVMERVRKERKVGHEAEHKAGDSSSSDSDEESEEESEALRDRVIQHDILDSHYQRAGDDAPPPPLWARVAGGLRAWTQHSRASRYKITPELAGAAGSGFGAPETAPERMVRLLTTSPLGRAVQSVDKSYRALRGYLLEGVPFKTSTARRRERRLAQLQQLLDDICVETFLDEVLQLGAMELTTEEYVEHMNKKRKHFYRRITELTKGKATAEATKQLQMLKRRLELFEEANRERLEKQERAEHEIDLMKDLLLEQEAAAVRWTDSNWDALQARVLRWLARPARPQAATGKKLAHLLPAVDENEYPATVRELVRRRIMNRKVEDKKKSRLAKVAGLSYSSDLSSKTADDLVIAAECGDVDAVIDMLDKRDDLEDEEAEPRIPADAVNTDGVTATFAVLFMIMNREVLNSEMDFEDLGLTGVQRWWRRWFGGRGGGGAAQEVRMDLVLTLLLQYGGRLDFFKASDKDSLSMLHYAAMAGSLEMLEWLLLKGVPVNQPTRPLGRTALMLAVERNHLDSVMLLLRFGAISSLHALDAAGNNVLHYSVRTSSPVLVKILLLCGARANHRNTGGQLPAEKARTMNRFDVSTLLATYRTGFNDDVKRVEFLFETEVPAFGAHSQSVKFADDDLQDEIIARRAARAAAAAFTAAGAGGRGDGAGTVSALGLAAIKKRSQSYRVNRMWKQSLEQSSKIVGPGGSPLGRRQSSLVLRPQSAGAEGASSRSTLRAGVDGQVPMADRKKKRRLEQRSFIRPQSARV